MPGFLIGNGHSQISLPEVCPLNVLTDTYRYSNKQNEIFALKSTLNKFLDDKCFAETATLFIVLEGYLLNKKILFAEYDVQNIKDLVERMYTGIGENFFSRFRGCFSGALYDKKENKWVVFTNQIGNAPVFYLKNNGNFVAGSQVTYILEWCKEKKYN